jgi:DivIVA domain-containing protein
MEQGMERGTEQGAEEVEAPVFPHKPFLRLGYDRRAVDEFMTKVALAVHNERQTSVRAHDVASMRFPSRRLGSGYRMRDVDDYLGVAEALLRMREAARGVGPGPDPDAEAASRRTHHRTWWIYAVAAVLVVVIVVFTLLST